MQNVITVESKGYPDGGQVLCSLPVGRASNDDMRFHLFFALVYIATGSVCDAVCCRRSHLVWSSDTQECGNYDRRFVINSNGAGFNALPHGCETKVCNDGKPHGLFYCGVGRCNLAGCDCDGGCWGGDADPVDSFRKISGITHAVRLIDIKDPTTWG